MPRFFFDSYDGQSWQRDEVGDDLDVDEVMDQAVALLSELVRDRLSSHSMNWFEISVRNLDDEAIYAASLNFRDSLSRHLKGADLTDAVAC